MNGITARPELERLGNRLIAALARHNIPADQYITQTEFAGVNVWAPKWAVTDANPNLNRYPQASVTISDDYAWGHHFEHVLPLDTPSNDVAMAIVKTLPEHVVTAEVSA